jgi:hypothetical protein
LRLVHPEIISSATVERVARRVSRHHRRVGIAMLICAAIGVCFMVLAIAEHEAAATVVGVALVLVAPPLYIYRQRQDSQRIVDRLADTAANRLDLEWTHHRSMIQAHDRKGPHPMLVLDAVPRNVEIDGGLPVARIHRT